MTDKKSPQFKINLYDAWISAGSPTMYRMNLDTGVARQTLAKYIDEDGIVLDSLGSSVIAVCNYLGVEWTDVVEIIEGIVPLPASVQAQHSREFTV